MATTVNDEQNLPYTVSRMKHCIRPDSMVIFDGQKRFLPTFETRPIARAENDPIGKGGSMVGITSYGAYIPKYRLAREVMAKAWGPRYITGERAVANHDEDSLTMATEAVLSCLQGIDPKTVEGLLFASTTSPYLEKQASTLIATAADLSEDLFTADQLSSLRSGTASLKSAMDAVLGGSAKNILVTAADSRRGEPGSDSEQLFGDASAAILMGGDRGGGDPRRILLPFGGVPRLLAETGGCLPAKRGSGVCANLWVRPDRQELRGRDFEKI